MKKAALIVSFLFVCFGISIGQISVSTKIAPKKRENKFKQNEIDAIKSSTTYFYFPNTPDTILQKIENCLKGIWTVSRFEVTSDNKKTTEALSKNNSVFAMTGLYTNVISGNTTYHSSNFYLRLYDSNRTYACIELSPNSLKLLGRLSTRNYIYDVPLFYNYTIGSLINYYKYVNTKLLKNEANSMFTNVSNLKKLAELENDTLYIPNYAFIHFDAFDGSESWADISYILSSYKYPVQVIDMNELSDKILNDQKPFKYLTYVKGSSHTFVSITESKTGEIIYSKLKDFWSFNFTRGKLSHVNRKVSKAIEKHTDNKL